MYIKRLLASLAKARYTSREGNTRTGSPIHTLWTDLCCQVSSGRRRPDQMACLGQDVAHQYMLSTS